MWIVKLALSRPYTFVVAALVLLLLTPFVLLRTPTDIFPEINIPVVSVVWWYNGLSAQEMEERIVYNHERMISTLVNDIEHIESTSYKGAGVIKVFFQPGPRWMRDWRRSQPADRLFCACSRPARPRLSSFDTMPPVFRSSSTAWQARSSPSRNCKTWR